MTVRMSCIHVIYIKIWKMGKNQKDKNTIRFSVMPWGHINMAELDNAVRAANLSQHSFEFTLTRDIVPILEDRYRLSSGGLDLESAARELLSNVVEIPSSIFFR